MIELSKPFFSEHLVLNKKLCTMVHSNPFGSSRDFLISQWVLAFIFYIVFIEDYMSYISNSAIYINYNFYLHTFTDCIHKLTEEFTTFDYHSCDVTTIEKSTRKLALSWRSCPRFEQMNIFL